LFLTFFYIGCNAGSPVTPDYSDYPVPDGLAFRTAQMTPMPPGWIPDGTLMTDAEVMVYMAAHIAESITGGMAHPLFCAIYNQLHTTFVALNAQYPPPFTYARFLVWWMEVHSYNVPDEQDIFPDC